MIITRLKGGLGNQMFQYAAGLALAERHQTTLKLDVSWFMARPDHAAHNRYALSCFNITEQFASPEEIRAFEPLRLTRTEKVSVLFARFFHFYQYTRRHTRDRSWHVPAAPGHDPAFATLPDGSALDGYFQSEKHFEAVAGLLRLHFSFRYPAPPAVARLAERIRSGPSIGVHFRRGDYRNNPALASDYGELGTDYYLRAIELLRHHSPDAVVYVFSDDIEAVASEFTPPGKHVFVRGIEAWHAHDTLRLMALCEHLVIANSTFSWWAAWLNDSPAKQVIAPLPWFASASKEPADLVPARWTRLSR